MSQEGEEEGEEDGEDDGEGDEDGRRRRGRPHKYVNRLFTCVNRLFSVPNNELMHMSKHFISDVGGRASTLI